MVSANLKSIEEQTAQPEPQAPAEPEPDINQEPGNEPDENGDTSNGEE